MRNFTVLLCIFSFFLHSARSEAQTPVSPPSLIKYELNPKDFPPKLGPLVLAAKKGAKLISTDKKAGVKELTACRKKATSMLGTFGRGLHDELLELSGFCAEKLGLDAEAQEDYEKSLTLRSSNSRVRFRLALLLQAKGEHQRAIKEFREVLWETKIAKHEVLFKTAESMLALEKKEEAFKIAEQARVKNPGFLPALRLLIELRREQITKSKIPLEQAQLEAQIAADLTLIATHDPSDKEAGLSLVRLLLKNSDPLLNAQRLEEAEQIAARFASSSKFKDDESVRLLFDSQMKQGKIEAAEATLSKGQSVTPDSELLSRAAQQLQMEKQLKLKESGEAES